MFEKSEMGSSAARLAPAPVDGRIRSTDTPAVVPLTESTSGLHELVERLRGHVGHLRHVADRVDGGQMEPGGTVGKEEGPRSLAEALQVAVRRAHAQLDLAEIEAQRLHGVIGV